MVLLLEVLHFGSFTLNIIGDTTNTVTGLTLVEKGSAAGNLSSADASYFSKAIPSDAQARLIGSTAAAGYIYQVF